MNYRKLSALVLCLVPIALSGCEMMHNLQPHRLRRLNRGSAPHLDPEFTQADDNADIKLVHSRIVTPTFVGLSGGIEY